MRSYVPVSPKAIFTRTVFETLREGQAVAARSRGPGAINLETAIPVAVNLASGDFYLRPTGDPDAALRRVTGLAGTNLTLESPLAGPGLPATGGRLIFWCGCRFVLWTPPNVPVAACASTDARYRAGTPSAFPVRTNPFPPGAHASRLRPEPFRRGPSHQPQNHRTDLTRREFVTTVGLAGLASLAVAGAGAASVMAARSRRLPRSSPGPCPNAG